MLGVAAEKLKQQKVQRGSTAAPHKAARVCAPSNRLAVADALDQAVAHDGVLVLACKAAAVGVGSRPGIQRQQQWRHAIAAAPRFCAAGRVKPRRAAATPSTLPHLSQCQSRCGRSSSWRCQACSPLTALRARLLRAPASRLLRLPLGGDCPAVSGGRNRRATGVTEMREGRRGLGRERGFGGLRLGETPARRSLQAWDKGEAGDGGSVHAENPAC